MDQGLLNLITIIVGGGGIVGGIVALIKVRPETARVVVSAAEGAVVVQAKVIKSLTDENHRLKEECEDCHEEVVDLRELVELITERKRKRRKSDPLPEEAPDQDGNQ